MNQTLRTPLQVRLVGLGQVFWHGGEFAFVGTACMAGNTLTTVQNFHAALGGAYFHLLSDEWVGHAVAGLIELDVRVDVRLDRLEHGEFPGLHGHGPQGRGIDLGKDTGAASGELLTRLVVELL
jgi:hypothetical protein